jgi:hypothetical protein
MVIRVPPLTEPERGWKSVTIPIALKVKDEESMFPYYFEVTSTL